MNFASRLSQQVSVPILVVSLLNILIPQLAYSQTSSGAVPSLEPLETELLEPNTSLVGRNVITANTISATDLTTPSFWWTKQQFDEFDGKLTNNWIAYPDEKRIDLVVNSQLWTLLDYLGRYRFLNKFGTAARDYQYNVRVFNQQANHLATYTCDYGKTPPDCEIKIFDLFGQDSLPVPRRQLGGD
jgi:hypothetical protein